MVEIMTQFFQPAYNRMMVYIQINLVVLVVETVEMCITVENTQKNPYKIKAFNDF